MKIAVVGSHGTGKSTLSQRLSEALDIPVIPDIVVEAHNKGFTINENTPLETQFWLFAKQLEFEKNFGESWIADKCLIDYSVYGDVLLQDQRAKELLAEMIRRNASYDLLFYLPVEFPVPEDGVLRSTDPVFRQKIDDRYQELLRQWEIEHYLITGSVEDRFEKAMEKIREKFGC